VSESAEACGDTQTQLGAQLEDLCENFETMSADPAIKIVDVVEGGRSEVVTGNVPVRRHQVGYNIVVTGQYNEDTNQIKALQ
jgi:hypothetical protein